MNLLGVNNIHYGNHVINMTGPENIRLSDAAPGATNPTNVQFSVFNGTTGAPWHLMMSASPPTAGNTELSRRLYRENAPSGGVGLDTAADRAANSASILTVPPANTVGPITTFNWAHVGFNGAEVRTVAGAPPISGEHQAYLFWTIHAGLT